MSTADLWYQAIAGDLGLLQAIHRATEEFCRIPPSSDDPLSVDIPSSVEDVHLSPTGTWCLWAYSVFAAELFDADYRSPDITTFPNHVDMLQSLLADDPQNRVAANAGTAEALVVLGLWLDHSRRAGSLESEKIDFLAYHHLLTLIAVFHPSISVRNASTTLAGLVLHSYPDDGERVRVLEDLLENCVFASLQACAVSWLREELIMAQQTGQQSIFSSAEAIERVQYVLFPDLLWLKDAEGEAIEEYWTSNYLFLLQVANFAYFLFGSQYKHLVPQGMGAAIEERYVEPLRSAAKKLLLALSPEKSEEPKVEGLDQMQVEILLDRLQSITL